MLILMTGTPQVQAQTNPNASAAPNTVYLPLIAGGAGVTKSKSGIHLGNRNSDWSAAFLHHLQPPSVGDATDQWPAAVVIQSNQVYDIFRSDGIGPSNTPNTGPKPCWVDRAAVKQNNRQDYAVYDYLTRAIHAGTKVVIRISPSPGNFLDYAHPGLAPHTLYTTTIAGGDYCGDPETQKHKAEKFRDVYDLAAEMNAIYLVNQAHGWPSDRFYFEPANEPNQEWYQSLVDSGAITLTPKIDNKQAWIEMDNYFAALYDQAIALQPNLQILAPSISQDLYGEHYDIGTCTPKTVVGGNDRSGMDFMKKVYGYDLGLDAHTTPKADGFAWHNYWRQDQEMWLPPYRGGSFPPTVDEYCDAHLLADPENQHPYKPPTDHFFQYLSGGMQQSIATLPTFITEGDLKSPCQLGEEGVAVSKDATALGTSNSLLTFIKAEARAYANTGYGAQYIIAWLLINQFDDEAPTCKSLGADGKKHANANYEQNWHEAYREDGQPRDWFTQWWATTP
ncbi:MAG: hypothetical protein U0350_42800 [Caldilineaceae bacterium]